jgi:hypothetical protein
MPRGRSVATLPGEMDGEKNLCRLEQAEGREIPCPEDACAFWEPGGAALEGQCVLHGIDFTREPELASWLLELRNAAAPD